MQQKRSRRTWGQPATGAGTPIYICPWETTAQGSPFINPDYMYWSDRTRRIPSWMGSADWKHAGCWCNRRGSWSVQTGPDEPLLTRRNQSAISWHARSTTSHTDLYYEVNNLRTYSIFFIKQCELFFQIHEIIESKMCNSSVTNKHKIPIYKCDSVKMYSTIYWSTFLRYFTILLLF